MPNDLLAFEHTKLTETVARRDVKRSIFISTIIIEKHNCLSAYLIKHKPVTVLYLLVSSFILRLTNFPSNFKRSLSLFVFTADLQEGDKGYFRDSWMAYFFPVKCEMACFFFSWIVISIEAVNLDFPNESPSNEKEVANSLWTVISVVFSIFFKFDSN